MLSISIIIPVYNVEQYVRRCIESITSQSDVEANIECIIIDDCSPDNSIQIIRAAVDAYDGPIRFMFLRHEVNQGLSVTRNTGMAHATGDYILFVDSDDHLKPGSLQYMVKNLLLYPGTDMVVGNAYVTRGNFQLLKHVSSPLLLTDKNDFFRRMLHKQIYLYAWNKLIRRDLLIRNHLYFEKGIVYEDILWTYLVFSHLSNVLLLPDITYVYEFNASSIVNTTYSSGKTDNIVISYGIICNMLLDNPPVTSLYSKNMTVDYLQYIGTELMRATDVIAKCKTSPEANEGVYIARKRLMMQTLHCGRIILTLFFLLLYPPLNRLQGMAIFRHNLFYVTKIVNLLGHLTDFIHHKSSLAISDGSSNITNKTVAEKQKYKIVYCTPALYLAGGVERVLTLKANYLADVLGYDVTFVITEGRDKLPFFPLSDKVKVINLDINFEELWYSSFAKKLVLYVSKQYHYRRQLKATLMRLRPDITISTMRREINFLPHMKDGSRKIGELHVNRANFRNVKPGETGLLKLKQLFARYWQLGIVNTINKLDAFVVLTEADRNAWPEISRIHVIPNPLPFFPKHVSLLKDRRIVSVGRYYNDKGFDLLLQAWALVEKAVPHWRLDLYGDGERTPFEALAARLQLDVNRYAFHGRVKDVAEVYQQASLYVCSSRFEGFGLTLIESMASGVPVVSFDCPWGPRSIIADGEDGVLVSDGDVQALAKAIVAAVTDPARLAVMGRKARQNVQRFSIEAIGARWQQLFDQLANSELCVR